MDWNEFQPYNLGEPTALLGIYLFFLPHHLMQRLHLTLHRKHTVLK